MDHDAHAEAPREAPSYLTRGSAYWLWYYKSPLAPPVPIGITDSPAPSDLTGVYSVPIGASGAARFGEMLSHGSAELLRLINRYATIDKVLPPWPIFGGGSG